MSAAGVVNRTFELVYELNVDSAMSPDVISVPPDLPMSELRWVLKNNRISGVPVVSEERLAGIISIEDFINWLADDGCSCTVGDKMSPDVLTVYSDEPLIRCVGRLDERGYGRLPVLDRQTERLVGIVTKGDIIERLLRKLEVDYQDEEIRNYRASHFFEDIIARHTRLTFDYEIRGKRIEEGGEVASALKKTMKRLGIHPSIVRRVAIVAYEAEMNVIIYASEAHVTVTIDPSRIHVEVEDRGPGIPDVELAMQPGYSTASERVRELGFGAGMGLSNIKQCADEMAITSRVGEGTLLKVKFRTEPRCA